MNAGIESRPGPVKNRTTVERKSDREVVVTRTINGPARIVFEASQSRALQRWVTKSCHGPCVLRGGCACRRQYGLVFEHGAPSPPRSSARMWKWSRTSASLDQGRGEAGPSPR